MRQIYVPVLVGAFLLVGPVAVFAQESGPLFQQPVILSLPNTTPGTSGSSGTFTITGGAGATAVADMNHDGLLDLVYVSNGVNSLGQSPTMNVLLHDGTVAASVPLGQSCTLGGIVIADVNKDGFPDVVLGCGGKQLVFPGTGTGALNPPVAVTTVTGAVSFQIADLNGDGLPDEVIAGSQGISVALNNGAGLGAFTSYPLGSTPNSVRVADFNGDGKVDLIAAGGNQLSLLLGNGDGTFQQPIELLDTGASSCLGVGDLNGDGLADIVSCATTSSAITVIFGNRAGKLSVDAIYPVSTFLSSGPVLISPLTTGGVPEVFYGQDAQIFYNDGNGNLSAGGAVAPFDGFRLADWNGDGKLDIVSSADGLPSEVAISYGDGVGNFTGTPPAAAAGSLFEIGEGISFSGEIEIAPVSPTLASADFNGDGLLDFAGSPIGGGIDVQLTNGDGTATAVTATGNPANGSLYVADLNHDGKPDVLDLSLSSSNGHLEATPCLNGGGGRLACGMTQDLGQTPGNFDGAAAVADFDGDGIPDLVFAAEVAVGPTSFQEVAYFAKGLGSGQFGTPVLLDGVYFNSPLFAASLRNNGVNDLVDGFGKVLLGNGNGTFQAPVYVAQDVQIRAVADLDGDGFPDMVATSFAMPQVVTIFTGNGDGTFTPGATGLALPVDFEFEQSVAAVGDLNGDGKPDLLLSGAKLTTVGNAEFIGAAEMVVLYNQGGNIFALDANGPYVGGGQVTLGRLNNSAGTAGSDKYLDAAVGTGGTIAYLFNLHNAAPAARAASVTALAVSPDPLVAGAEITLTATVSPALGGGKPTGSVTFFNGSQQLSTVSLMDGVATASGPSAGYGEGIYSIVARYSGDGRFRPSASQAKVAAVTQGTSPTITVFRLNVTGILQQNSALQLHAAVYPAVGNAVPTGTVGIYLGSSLIGSASLVNGQVDIAANTNTLPGGNYPVHAYYSGDAQNAASTSETHNYTLRNATVTALTLSPQAGAAGTPVLLAAHVSRQYIAGVPQGQVEFGYVLSDGSELLLGFAAPDASGNATLTATVPSLAVPGSYNVRASLESSEYDEASVGNAAFSVTAP